MAHDNPLDMTTIRGTVIEIIPDYDYTHADQLAKKIHEFGKNIHLKELMKKRIIFKIKPGHVYILPSISMNQG